MLGWSLPLGRVFGVSVRLHSFFVFLLLLAMSWASYLGRPMVRGVVLWGLVLLAVGVREVARGLAGAYFGLQLKSLLLLPTGGIPVYGPGAGRAETEAGTQRVMALAGPGANLLCGLTLAGLILTVAPGVNLLEATWVSPAHLLRALVWLHVLLAVVNLLPAWPLDGGRMLQGQMMREGAHAAGMKRIARLGPAIALGLIVVGLGTVNWWVITLGISLLLVAQVERQGLLQEAPEGETVRVGDVMLSEYSILSASATLEDAVMQARQTLQDVFPVVRAGNMVGAVGRLEILKALEATGNGYVQGIMARVFQTAGPEDALGATLGRVTGQTGVSSQLVPVVVGERIVGILTPQNLHRSMGMLVRKMAPGRRGAGAGSGRDDDEDERD